MATFGLRYFAQLRSKYKGVFWRVEIAERDYSGPLPGKSSRAAAPCTSAGRCYIFKDRLEEFEKLQLRILFGTKRASNRVTKRLVCPVNLKNSILFVPIEVDNYDYTGRNIAVPAL